MMSAPTLTCFIAQPQKFGSDGQKASWSCCSVMSVQSTVEVCLLAAGDTPLLRWWRQEVHIIPASPTQECITLTSKAPLKQRKVVNTRTPEGRLVGVNAQQYAVLVTNIRSAPLDSR